MELYPNSEDQEDLAAISLLPLPSFAVAWDPSIVRPSKLPERYDKRISAKYIFYLPSEDKYVVSKRCDGCRKAVQACDRAWPGCTRCVRSKKKCHVSDQGYVPLPGPKQERGKVLSSKGLTEMNPGVSAKTARTKRLERRPKNASELTSAVSTSNVHPGQRKSGKSKHNLLNPDEHGWDFIHPPKYERHSKMSAFESTPAHPQQPTLPPLWAASQADLLVALPHYPDIMDRQGLGCYGGFIDFFILEGSGWSDDSWVGRGTINLTRHEIFMVFGPDTVLTQITYIAANGAFLVHPQRKRSPLKRRVQSLIAHVWSKTCVILSRFTVICCRALHIRLYTQTVSSLLYVLTKSAKMSAGSANSAVPPALPWQTISSMIWTPTCQMTAPILQRC
ncbi:hypothetical protein JB92DRAFT_130473 [Gautieria morchelliformis]|nr:hypothetical protein JB92DRAFT_130473 [Gautieria morchelliformis]